jgi:hypothetical protein
VAWYLDAETDFTLHLPKLDVTDVENVASRIEEFINTEIYKERSSFVVVFRHRNQYCN